MIEIPEVVANRARSVGAQAWLQALPELVNELFEAWGLRSSGPSYDGGTEAVVVPVEADQFGPAVLKLLVPREIGLAADAAVHEITVLERAGGNGLATLFRSDQRRGAMLIERLGPSLFDLSQVGPGLTLKQRHRIQCRVAARVWQPVPAAVVLPTGAEKATWLIDYITAAWDQLGQPCSTQAIDHAMACAQRRLDAHNADTATLVHGDVNDWNVLRTLDRSDYKLIDPDGLVAEPEYDLGVIMREDPLELLAEVEPMNRAHRLAEWAQEHTALPIDPVKVWEWGVVERVSTGLMATEINLQPIGRQMLATADKLAANWEQA